MALKRLRCAKPLFLSHVPMRNGKASEGEVKARPDCTRVRRMLAAPMLGHHRRWCGAVSSTPSRHMHVRVRCCRTTHQPTLLLQGTKLPFTP